MENFTNNPLEIGSLPRFEEVEYHKISSRFLIKTNIQTGIFLFVVLLGLFALYYYGAQWFNLYLGIGILVLFFVFKFWNNYMLQNRYGYALREKDILYRRGFLFNTTTVIPFNRIQHVSTSRDALDKILNISSLQIFTAGGSGSDIGVPGLTPELAVQLKEALAKRVSINEE